MINIYMFDYYSKGVPDDTYKGIATSYIYTLGFKKLVQFDLQPSLDRQLNTTEVDNDGYNPSKG